MLSSGDADGPRNNTQRESPQLATMMCDGVMNASTAVLPAECFSFFSFSSTSRNAVTIAPAHVAFGSCSSKTHKRAHECDGLACGGIGSQHGVTRHSEWKLKRVQGSAKWATSNGLNPGVAKISSNIIADLPSKQQRKQARSKQMKRLV
jgi:hypothetical protein